MFKPFSFLYIICGIMIGLLLFIYPASVFYMTMVLATGFFLYKKTNNLERHFILYIFSFGLLLRLIIIALTHILYKYYGFGPKSYTFPGMEAGAIFGDDVGIHLRAWALASMIKGISLSEIQIKTLLNLGEYGWSFHIYVLGFLYYLFGSVPLLGKCVNALFGVLTGIIVYFIGRELFGTRTAKLACTLTVFFPTLFLWSIANLKDTVLIFMVSCSLLCYALFRKRGEKKYLLFMLFFFFGIDLYRPGIIFIFLFAFFASFIFGLRWSYNRILAASILSFAILITFGLNSRLASTIKGKLNRISISQLILQQGGAVASGGTSAYKIYPDRFYYIEGFDKDRYKDTIPITMEEFIVSLSKGIISLIFRPFPSDIDNAQKALFYPVSAAYGILSIFFLLGSLIALRYYARASSFFILLFIMLSLLLALTAGNIGNMVRHRDMITPIYIIFSSFGIVQLLSRIKYRQPQYSKKEESRL